MVASNATLLFGQKITKDDLLEKSHALDPSAHAAILSKSVKMSYDFEDSRGIQLVLEYKSIIKIYDDEGLDRADFSLPFYVGGSSKERIKYIKGTSYNLEGDRIVKSKLGKKDVFQEDLNENYTARKFAMPNVKAGTIIEVEYTKYTPFIYTIPKWYFQDYIPTNRSEFMLDVPSYFSLTPVASGFIPLNRKEQNVPLSPHGEVRHILVANDVPAIKEDNYVLNENDYRSGIKYEIFSTNFPGQETKFYSKDWNKIASNLMEAKYFGKQLKKKFKEMEPIIKEANSLDLDARMKFLFDYVQSNYSWNKSYGRGSYDGLKKCIKDKSGSVGDLNLLLLNLLKKCDVSANPVVLKSRFNGILNTNYPSLSELNYVIAMVELKDKTILLDASSKLSPFGELPIRAINVYGVKITDKSGEIIQMKNKNRFLVSTASKYEIDLEENKIIGTSQRRRNGYAAQSIGQI